MNNILEIIKPYIEDLFDPDAIYELVAINRVRVTGPNPNSKQGFKFRRPIILIFENEVINAYSKAKTAGDERSLTGYVHSLKRIVKTRLVSYDPDGDKGSAFEIYLDSRATDL